MPNYQFTGLLRSKDLTLWEEQCILLLDRGHPYLMFPLSREEYISTTIFSEEKDGMPGGRGGRGGGVTCSEFASSETVDQLW